MLVISKMGSEEKQKKEHSSLASPSLSALRERCAALQVGTYLHDLYDHAMGLLWLQESPWDM